MKTTSSAGPDISGSVPCVTNPKPEDTVWKRPANEIGSEQMTTTPQPEGCDANDRGQRLHGRERPDVASGVGSSEPAPEGTVDGDEHWKTRVIRPGKWEPHAPLYRVGTLVSYWDVPHRVIDAGEYGARLATLRPLSAAPEEVGGEAGAIKVVHAFLIDPCMEGEHCRNTNCAADLPKDEWCWSCRMVESPFWQRLLSALAPSDPVKPGAREAFDRIVRFVADHVSSDEQALFGRDNDLVYAALAPQPVATEERGEPDLIAKTIQDLHAAAVLIHDLATTVGEEALTVAPTSPEGEESASQAPAQREDGEE